MRSGRFFGLTLAVVVSVTAAAQTQPAPPIPDRNAQPALASAPDGTIHAVWTEGPLGSQEIRHSQWSGTDWSEPESVVSDASVSGLDVLVRPDGVVCVYWATIPLLESCRVSDRWTEPVEIGREAASTEFKPAYAPDGRLHVVHLEPPTGVYYGDSLLNPADEVVTFPRLVIDAEGGLHAFWFDFTADRGWVWSHSPDDGATWSPFESLSTTLPQSSGTLVVADPAGGIHSVLLSGFDFEHMKWGADAGWSEVGVVEFTPGAIAGALVAAPSGQLTLLAATGSGLLEFVRSSGGVWSDPVIVAGTEGRSIDAVLAASDDAGRITVLWHELGAIGFNQTGLGGESLVSSIPSPAQVSLDPIVVAASVALTAGVLFLVPFPAEIFNNTLAEHYDEIRGWFRRREQPQRGRGFWDRPLGLVLFLLVCSLLYGFLDPGFGANAASAVVLVGLFVGVTVTTAGFAVPTILVRHARVEEWGRLRALPLALAVGSGCVLVSRLVGFVPGYLYAIVLAVVFVGEVSRSEEARGMTISGVALLALALLCWVGLGLIRSGSAAGVAVDLGEAALAMTVASAFEALAIGLLPLRGLPGMALFVERKRVWLVLWGVSVFAFFHFIINPANGYLVESTLVPLATTIGLLVLFTLLSLGLWGFFNLRRRGKITPTRA